ncbi:MAG: CHAT domain-containing protein [Bryobacterales bacterium]|nr:CHAT domain-containing protein [Bryobacterales bacterium]
MTFAPSATAHVLLRHAPTGNPDLPLLGIGDVPYTSITGARGSVLRPSSRARGLYDVAAAPVLAPLPQSRFEIEQARRLAGGESVVLLGDEATESNLKRQPIERFQVLHFAVHGYADPQVPQRAALVLKGDPTTSEDGLLQPREISRLPLRAKLVVLSACSTAIGRSLGQEGVANLARAFLLGGAQAVVLTLWSVSDEGSSTLMESFYRNIAAGSDVATSCATQSRLCSAVRTGRAACSLRLQLVGNGAVRIEFQQGAKN